MISKILQNPNLLTHNECPKNQYRSIDNNNNRVCLHLRGLSNARIVVLYQKITKRKLVRKAFQRNRTVCAVVIIRRNIDFYKVII